MVEESTPVVEVKRMRLRYAGTCTRCGTRLEAGTTADYFRGTKSVACVACPPAGEGQTAQAEAGPAVETRASAKIPEDLRPPEPPSVLGVVDGQGGASAAAEFKRRHDARQQRVVARHPRMGRFLLAVFDDPQSTRAWSAGAEGERLLAGMLAANASDTLRVLNDRRIPRTRANIDHLVVCPSGVFVIDAKRYRNARPELRVAGGLIRQRTERLVVGGRDRDSLVAGVQKQVERVRTALDDRPAIPVRGVLCFVDADWPLIGGSFTVDGVAVVWPKKLKALLKEPGALGPDTIADVQFQLHEAFPRHL